MITLNNILETASKLPYDKSQLVINERNKKELELSDTFNGLNVIVDSWMPYDTFIIKPL